jgi:photosystem II stability/assembly factor-like uncharacterized protein
MKTTALNIRYLIIGLLCCIILSQPLRTQTALNGYVTGVTVKNSTILSGTFGGGVFKSTNGGTDWYSTNLGLSNYLVNTIDVIGSNIYLGLNGGGLYKSTDDGENWVASSPGYQATNVTGFYNGAVYQFITTIGNGVIRSSDQGNTWVSCNNGIPIPFINSILQSGTQLFVVTSGYGIYVSSNSGNTWTSANYPLPNSAITTFHIVGSTYLVGTTNAGIYRSTDNGSTWNTVVYGYTTGSINKFTNVLGNIYCATQNGVLLSTNNGATWNYKNTGLNYLDMATISSINGYLYAGSNGGGVFLSTDGGNNWISKGLIFTNTSTVYQNKKMTLSINGFPHQVHDNISDIINYMYVQNKGNFITKLQEKLSAKLEYATTIMAPDVISGISYYGNGEDSVTVDIAINNIRATFNTPGCSNTMDFDIGFRATYSVGNKDGLRSLIVSGISPSFQITKLKSNNTAWYRYWNYITCYYTDDLLYFSAWAAFFVSETIFSNELSTKAIPITVPSGIEGLTPDKVDEALASFPMKFTFGKLTDGSLNINIEMLSGTLADGDAYIGIPVTQPINNKLEYLGFNLSGKSIDSAFGTYTDSTIVRPFPAGSIDAIQYVLQTIQNNGGKSIVRSFDFYPIANNTFLTTSNHDTSTLHGEVLDTMINNLYSNGNWNRSDTIFNILDRKPFDLIAQLGGMCNIVDAAGKSGKMLPDNGPSHYYLDEENDKSYYYVSPETYLYYQKILAHAIVRRYRNSVGTWMIEAELNSTKFNTWWYKGNAWQDHSNNGFVMAVFKTWVNAIRQEDPSAKIVNPLHMINFEFGLEKFGPDCDIIGINLYPNELFATPVFGEFVKDYLWSVRRAMKYWGWENKPIWITETNYPGKDPSTSENPSSEVSPVDNITWYSYGRQEKYMRDVIKAAADGGAKGLFWWNFIDSEKAYDPLPHTGWGSLLVNNTNPPELKPAVDAFFQTAPTYHDGKTKIALKNASSSTGVNIGGYIGINGVKDFRASGDTLYLNTNTLNEVRTYNQNIISLKHRNWVWTSGSPDYSKHKLIESYTPNDNQPKSISAQFYSVAPFSLTLSVLDNNSSASGMLGFTDPWYLDQNNSQSGSSKEVTINPSYTDNIFLNTFGQDGEPKYRIEAPLTQNILVNGQSIPATFNRWSILSGAADLNIDQEITDVTFLSTTPTTISAEYKLSLTSSNGETFKYPGQRRIAKSNNNYLCMVYESNGKIWTQLSSNNGTSWSPPEKQYEAGTKPTICGYGDDFILLVQKAGEFTLSRLVLNGMSVYKSFEYSYVPSITISDSSNGTIACSPNGLLVFCWSGNKKVNFKFFNVNASSFTEYSGTNSSGTFGAGTSNVHLTPAIATSISEYGFTDAFYLTWEQRNASVSNIMAKKFGKRNGNIDITYFAQQSISSGNGYTKNYTPSIVTLNDGNAKINWIGQRNSPSNPDVQENVSMFKLSEGSVFYGYGNLVTSTQVNRSNSGFLLAYSQNGPIYYKTHTTYNHPQIYSLAGLTGSQVQVAEGISNSVAIASLNTNSQPYKINFGAIGLAKSDGYSIANGRGGIITQGEVDVYFTLGDVYVDGSAVPYVELMDSTGILNTDSISRYVKTIPFNLSDNSVFTFSVQFGISDTAAAKSLFENDASIRFSVKLLDSETKEIIGEYDDVTFNRINPTRYDNLSYLVNTNGIGNRNVILVLSVDVNEIEPQVSIINRQSNDYIIAKKGEENYIRLHYNGKEEVIDYLLTQNFPNPFNPATTINYALPKSGNVILKVYDILGKEVATLVNNHQETGRYSVQFDATKLASGMYIYKLTSGTFTEVKKMMLVK